MHYLTTHDLVWINSTLTGRAEPYDYVLLEAAMAGQYSYGQSSNVACQAANLFSSLLYKAPFAAGNTRTAVVATLTFLNANGYETQAEDEEIAAVAQSVAQHELSAAQAIDRLAIQSEQAQHGGKSLRALMAHECNAHSEALKLLAAGD